MSYCRYTVVHRENPGLNICNVLGLSLQSRPLAQNEKCFGGLARVLRPFLVAFAREVTASVAV